MHLLAATAGGLQDENTVIDVSQTPTDLLIMSVSDTDLILFSKAQRKNLQSDQAPGLVLGNLGNLRNNASIDAYIDRIASNCKGVVAILLGGYNYWSYLCDQLKERCQHTQLMLINPQDAMDLRLASLGTATQDQTVRFGQFLSFGGLDNACCALKYLDRLWFHPNAPREDEPYAIDPVSIWSPSLGIIDFPSWQKECLLAQDTKTPQKSTKAPWVVAVLFYRAYLQSHSLGFVESLLESLREKNLYPIAIALDSLKQPESKAKCEALLKDSNAQLIINLTAFNAANLDQRCFNNDAIVLQGLISSTQKERWEALDAGLIPRDLVMFVTMPELDGRIITRLVALKKESEYCEKTQIQLNDYVAVKERQDWISDLALSWVRLRNLPNWDKKIALILANYPTKDGRLGNGVGLDTPASLCVILSAMKKDGYVTGDPIPSGDAIMAQLRKGPTNDPGKAPTLAQSPTLCLSDYQTLSQKVTPALILKINQRWGNAKDDPQFQDGAFNIPGLVMGHCFIGLQPARGYHIDNYESYHDPSLIPPHAYLAFYLWLRFVFSADAMVSVGKHGNLEWLPGKSVALSENCWPDLMAGVLPHLYPFIVNDPGEGVQAKRRAQAVIIDHLMPPLTRADTYGELSALECDMDEYYQALSLDQVRAKVLKIRLLDRIKAAKLDREITSDQSEEGLLQSIDAYLCEIKESQIRDGLHIFGQSPKGSQRLDTLMALSRLPAANTQEKGLLHAMSADFGLTEKFDPLNCDMSLAWNEPKPKELKDILDAPWRTFADTKERLEHLALILLDQPEKASHLPHTHKALMRILNDIATRLDCSGSKEVDAMLEGLRGRFIDPGPAGAPSRGRVDVLPTGRNFYSIDLRTLPTTTAYDLGFRAASEMITRFRQDHGEDLKSIGLSVWGTSTIRTGGDDIAQALALIGVKPVWAGSAGRVTGIEVIPASLLDRPRVDVTLRISGFFRDAFPNLIELFDQAVRMVSTMDESCDDNPIAARFKAECQALIEQGHPEKRAQRLAGFRVFGSKPGSYGAGLQSLIDERNWQDKTDLARAYLKWSSYAYDATHYGEKSEQAFQMRLGSVQAVVHNQDNREHDILDSDDYYQFQGGMAAAVASIQGKMPTLYHGDHSNPGAPKIKSLKEEISRVIRSRVVNPKWIKGIMRHGYKGVFEMAATVDYLFAYDATCDVVDDHQYELVCEAYLFDEKVAQFARACNPDAFYEMTERMMEAIARDQWHADAHTTERLEALLLDLENTIETG